MKRTALMMALLTVTAAMLLYLAPIPIVLIFGAVLFLMAVTLFVLCKKIDVDHRSIAVLLGATLVCVGFFVFGVTIDNASAEIEGKSGKILCTVVDEPSYQSGYTILTVKTSENYEDNSNLCGRRKLMLWINMSDEASSADVGDVLEVNVVFNKSNESFKRRYYQDGVYLNVYCYSAKVIGEKFVIQKPIVELRRYIRSVLSWYLSGDTKALMNGLMLGNINDISDESRSDLKTCGVSHIVAVSGLHISIITSLLLSFLRKFLSPRKASLFLLIPLMLVVAVTGFTPSAVRAGIMCAITFIGAAVFKKTDSLNTLGVAICLMLLYNPYIISSISFQLSCSATAGVIIAAPYSAKYSKKICGMIRLSPIKIVVGEIVQIFCISVGATLFTMPFQIIYFGYVSVIAPLTNVLVSVAVTYALSLGVVGILIYAVPYLGVVAIVPIKLAGLFANYILAAVHILADIPFSYIPIGDKLSEFCLMLITALLALWFLLNRVGGVRFVSLLSCALVITAMVSSSIAEKYKVTVTVLDLGKTYCTAVSYGKSCMLFGCGDDENDYYSIKSYLKTNAIYKIEGIVLWEKEQLEKGCFDKVNSEHGPETIYLTKDCNAPDNVKVSVLSANEKTDLKINATLEMRETADGNVLFVKAFNKTVAVAGSSGFSGVDVSFADVIITDTKLPSGKQRGLTFVKGENREADNEFSGETLFFPKEDITIVLKQGKEVTYSAK